MYEFGLGVDQDYEQAVVWYRKSAKQGDDVAQCNLGYIYEFGTGVEQDLEEAMTWYLKAADQELPRAQYCIGLLYENGKGVKKNIDKAVSWYQKAADQGHEEAQQNWTVLAGSRNLCTVLSEGFVYDGRINQNNRR